jgi:uncharacterized protein
MVPEQFPFSQGDPMHKSLLMPIISLAFLAGILVSAGCVHESGSLQTDQTISPGSAVPGLLSTVPDVRQSQPYSCGASALQAVFSYWGIDKREGVLLQELGTTEEYGTPPESIVNVARAYNFSAGLRTNLTLADLEEANTEKIPVIIACQAWSDVSPATLPWDQDWEDGHYMVVIGIDQENTYFEDPSLLGTRGVIPRQEFLSRWHDYEGAPPFGVNSTVLYHAGIFISGNRPAAYPVFTHVD